MSYGHSGINRTWSVSDTATSSLDGIPLVISNKFQQLPQVSLPASVLNAQPPRIIYEDIDFSLEHAVIQSYEEHQLAQLAEQEAQVRSVGAEIEDFSRASVDAAAGAAAAVNNDITCDTDAVDSGAVTVDNQCDSSHENVAKPRHNLLFNIGNEILLPTPIQPVRKLSPTAAEHVCIDLTDFEREEDPFDKLELKTINTMEELKNVLQVAQSQSLDGATTGQNDENVCDRNRPNGSITIGGSDNPMLKSDNENVCDNSIGRKLGARSVLPPIGSKKSNATNCEHVLFPEGRHSIAGLENYVKDPKHSSFNQIKTTNNSFNPYSCYFKRNKESVNINGLNSVDLDVVTHDKNSQFTDGSSVNDQSWPTLNPLRNALSTPDITRDSSASFNNRSVSPFKPLSPSPPPRPSSTQDWNRHSPLPNWQQQNTGDSSSTPCSPTPVDPFCSLPIGQQEFVLALADMGFPRSQVARAVKKFGPDDKVVIDHLCLVNRIVEKGYKDEQAEFSLALFDNNFAKACEYIEMVRQFEELGFESDKIREALVLHSNNRDEALDFLTAT
ncbi:ubiquitin-associated protein 1-like [Tubulanus polymorphus]|uniref:ubiquitin-associated protein 1-like n=1 Tax=Tubulanus polymorphus TaxID=672921 RepID=UPI003DA23499